MAIDVRSADTADLDRIEEVVAEALEPEDAEEARMLLEAPAFDRSRWLGAASDGRLESTMALLDSHFRIGAARFAAEEVRGRVARNDQLVCAERMRQLQMLWVARCGVKVVQDFRHTAELYGQYPVYIPDGKPVKPLLEVRSHAFQNVQSLLIST